MPLSSEKRTVSKLPSISLRGLRTFCVAARYESFRTAGSPEFKRDMQVKNKRILSEFPLIVHESQPKAWKKWAKAAGIALPENRKVTRLDSMIAVVRAAEQGLGAALVPVPLSNLWFKQGSIVRLFKQEFEADVSYYLVCKEDRVDDPAVISLRDWVLENFAEQG